jgi:enamine deaminase RidA (YjgF/YER057c/UK114 family)
MDRRPPATRQLISSGSPYEAPIGFSRAVRVGDRVVVAGTAPVWPDGHVDPDVEAQAARCLEIILTALHEAGASAADVVRTRCFLVAAADWEAVGRAHGRVFHRVRPASTMVVVAGLLDPRWKVEMEAEAVVGSAAPEARDGWDVPDA